MKVPSAITLFGFAVLTTLALLSPAPSAGAVITHGPILGRLSARGVGVWARTARAAEFRVRFGSAPGALDSVSEPARTSLDHDNAGWVLIDGLEPNTKYYYEVTGDVVGRPASELRGSFRTLPSAETFRHSRHNPRGLFNFSFEYGCGNKQSSDPSLPGFRTMLEQLDDKIDFAILDGDWLYEEKRDYPPAEWMKQAGAAHAPRVVSLAPTIVGVWENYKLYLARGKNLAAWHREIPSFFMFDDHEMLNDINGAGTPGLRSRRAVFRDIGTQAWYDYLGWSNPAPERQGIHFGKAKLVAGRDVLVD